MARQTILLCRHVERRRILLYAGIWDSYTNLRSVAKKFALRLNRCLLVQLDNEHASEFWGKYKHGINIKKILNISTTIEVFNRNKCIYSLLYNLSGLTLLIIYTQTSEIHIKTEPRLLVRVITPDNWSYVCDIRRLGQQNMYLQRSYAGYIHPIKVKQVIVVESLDLWAILKLTIQMMAKLGITLQL